MIFVYIFFIYDYEKKCKTKCFINKEIKEVPNVQHLVTTPPPLSLQVITMHRSSRMGKMQFF